MNKKILNLGCGQESYGDVRVDFVKTKTTTHVFNLNNKFPFKDEEFDEIYCKSVLEHIGNVKQFVEEAIRVLKKGGVFWFRTDNASYIPFHFRSHQDYIEDTYSHHSEEDRHYYLFKEEHLANLFKDVINEFTIKYTEANKELFFIPTRFKNMHIEISGEKES